MPIVSGGNSSCIEMLQSGAMPAGITNLRVNQAVLGRELVHGGRIEGWCDDAFTLLAEIVEMQVKPSLPVGEIAVMNAFGTPLRPVDRGKRKRAILSLGRQDLDCIALTPVAAGAEVVGASSDHMFVDITDCGGPCRVGDRMAFKVETYASLISAMASPYIRQTYSAGPESAGKTKTLRRQYGKKIAKKDYA